MSAENTRIFECFRAGRHTSMAGREMEFSVGDLEKICANYRHAKSKAPLVLGHPPDNLPAFGEVNDLFTRRGSLYAVAKVGEGLLNAVKQGYYKHVSAAFESASWLGNNGYSLRHIGFLGAHPPAVKGMAPLNFGEMVEPPGTVCFAAPTGNGVRRRPDLVIPPGWHVSPEGWACYLRAAEVEAACPNLSFAECAMLAETYLL